MGFNSAFKGLMDCIQTTFFYFSEPAEASIGVQKLSISQEHGVV